MIDFDNFRLSGFPIVSSFMKYPRIYRAWLPSVIFPLNYAYAIEREKTIVNGLPITVNSCGLQGSIFEPSVCGNLKCFNGHENRISGIL